jgi:hypothetical protein
MIIHPPPSPPLAFHNADQHDIIDAPMIKTHQGQSVIMVVRRHIWGDSSLGFPLPVTTLILTMNTFGFCFFCFLMFLSFTMTTTFTFTLLLSLRFGGTIVRSFTFVSSLRLVY